MSHGDRKRASILAEGVKLWRTGQTVSARRIGRALGMTHSAILYHWGNAEGLRNAVADEAVRIGDTVIVPMLIATKHPAVRDMPGEVRAQYLLGC